MRELGWPRPPLLLGLVLGDLVERYLFISVQLYGWTWVFRPLVLIMLGLALYGMYRPLRRLLANTVETFRSGDRSFNFGPTAWFSLAFVVVLAAALVISLDWPWRARIAPQIVAGTGLVFAVANLAVEVFRSGGLASAVSAAGPAMDLPGLAGTHASLAPSVVFRRGGFYFLWLTGLLLTAWLIGMLPALLVFGVCFARFEGGESWRTALLLGIGIVAGCWIVFDVGLGVLWPRSLLGDYFPALREALAGLI